MHGRCLLDAALRLEPDLVSVNCLVLEAVVSELSLDARSEGLCDSRTALFLLQKLRFFLQKLRFYFTDSAAIPLTSGPPLPSFRAISRAANAFQRRAAVLFGTQAALAAAV